MGRLTWFRTMVVVTVVAAGCTDRSIVIGSAEIVPPESVDMAHAFRSLPDAALPLLTARFSPFTVTGNFDQPISLVPGNFAEDGLLDLVVSNFLGHSLTYLHQETDGSFTATSRPGVYGLLAAGDFDGDHHLDLIVGQYGVPWSVPPLPAATQTITVLLGKGDGSFQDGAHYGDGTMVGSFEGGLQTGDLDGDGRLDLIYTLGFLAGDSNTPDHRLVVQMGNGDGTFGGQRYYDVGDLCPGGTQVGDFNGDGKTDVLVGAGDCADFASARPNGSLVVFLGNGDGTLKLAQTIDSGPCRSALVGDLDGDGHADLVSQDCVDNQLIDVLHGNGDGTFAVVQQIPINGSLYPSGALVDFDYDGHLDIPLTGRAEMAILSGRADLGYPSIFEAQTGDSGLVRTAFAMDLNNDGRVDLVGIDQELDQIDVFLNLMRY